MKHSLAKYYRKEKKRVLEKCKECGVCAKRCPIIKTTELAEVPPKEIQEQIKAYLKTGEANQTVFNRAFSCMQCFQCVVKCCPEGLDPLAVNEIIKWEYHRNKIVEMGYGDPKDADSAHRVLAGIQLSAEDYLKNTKWVKRINVLFSQFDAGNNGYLSKEDYELLHKKMAENIPDRPALMIKAQEVTRGCVYLANDGDIIVCR